MPTTKDNGHTQVEDAGFVLARLKDLPNGIPHSRSPFHLAKGVAAKAIALICAQRDQIDKLTRERDRLIENTDEMLATLKKHERALNLRAMDGPNAKPTVRQLNEMLADFRAAIAKAEGRTDG